MAEFQTHTVPRPRTSETSALSASRPISLPPSSGSPKHVRRPSVPMSPSLLSTSPRAVPVPVPERHGSISRPRATSTYNEGLIIPRSISPARMPLSAMSPPTLISSQKRQSQHQKNASSSASLVSLFAPSSAGASDQATADLSRSKSDKRKSMMADIRRSGTKESLKELAEDEGKWLDITAEKVLRVENEVERVKIVKGDMGMEEAVEIMIQSNYQCLLVEKRSSFAFFDYADLNTFLLLVLHASSSSPKASRSPSRSVSIKRTSRDYPAGESAVIDETAEPDGILDERSKSIVARLRRHEKVHIGSVCDISGKNPYHAFPVITPLRTLLPLFASGLHKMALTTTSTAPPRVLTDLAVIEHLVSLNTANQPIIFKLPITSSAAAFPLHPLISLPGTASVLDAMQVMSMNGLSALGVLSGPGSLREIKASRRQSSSGSSSSSSGALMFRSSSSGVITSSPLVSPAQEMMVSPFDVMGTGMGMGELKSVVTVKQCARVVVPSEGKRVLGMGLEEMVKMAQYVEEAGQDRGEERVPVHTVPYNSTILHAAHLILATSSSRVFLRPPSIPLSPQPAPTTVSGLNASPPLSPAPSLSTSQYSPPSSPSLSSLSLSDIRIPANSSALPVPPPTQLSTHYVVSTLDILSCLARAYHDKLTPPAGVHRANISNPTLPTPSMGQGGGETRRRERDRLRGSIMIPSGWELDPEALRRRRQSSFASQVSPVSAQAEEVPEESKGEGFGRWRWASRVGKV